MVGGGQKGGVNLQCSAGVGLIQSSPNCGYKHICYGFSYLMIIDSGSNNASSIETPSCSIMLRVARDMRLRIATIHSEIEHSNIEESARLVVITNTIVQSPSNTNTNMPRFRSSRFIRTASCSHQYSCCILHSFLHLASPSDSISKGLAL